MAEQLKASYGSAAAAAAPAPAASADDWEEF
jgi:hypothetical protein